MKIIDFDNIKKFKVLPEDTDTHASRLRELEWLSSYIPKGGYNLEFGVFSGTTINCLAKCLPDRHFYGFDSFEGLPEDWDMGGKHVKKEAFDRQGVLPDVESNVSLIKGYFDTTIPEWLKSQSEVGFERPKNKHISYLHVDCDIYSSTKTILDELNFMIVPGTVIRFDELCCWRSTFGEATPSKIQRVMYTTWKEHEWKALNEWLEKYDRKVVPICRNWFQSGTVVVTQ